MAPMTSGTPDRSATPPVSGTSLVFRRARSGEIDQAVSLVTTRADWLRGRGMDQWNHRDLSPDVRTAVEAGLCWLLLDGETPVATVTLATTADPDFWTPEEIAQPALYVSKAATALTHQGQGLGRLLLHTAATYAHGLGIRRLRWDVWKTNTALQQHYLEAGATYLRTVDLPHRFSGALFELAHTVLDDPARIEAPAEIVTELPVTVGHGWVSPDQPVAGSVPDFGRPTSWRECPDVVVTDLNTPPGVSPRPPTYPTKPRPLRLGPEPVLLFHPGEQWLCGGTFTHPVQLSPRIAALLDPRKPYRIINDGVSVVVTYA